MTVSKTKIVYVIIKKIPGNYSCLGVSLSLDRERGHIWTETFCPDISAMVLVLLSACLAPTSYVRFVLLLSVLMSKLVFATAGQRQLDKAEEWTALDIWRIATIGFVYTALVELILVS